MSSSTRLGAKIRSVRRQEGLTQARMAERIGISASYLNLIENNRRPLTAGLLIKLAQHFELDLKDSNTVGTTLQKNKHIQQSLNLFENKLTYSICVEFTGLHKHMQQI